MSLRKIFSIGKTKHTLSMLSRDELSARTEVKNRNIAVSATAFLISGAVATQDFNTAIQWTSTVTAIASGLNTLREAWNAHSLMNQSARYRNQDRMIELRRASHQENLSR